MPKHIGSSDCQQFGKGDDSVLGKQCASRGELFGSARTSRELVPSDRADTERLTEGRDLQQPLPLRTGCRESTDQEFRMRAGPSEVLVFLP